MTKCLIFLKYVTFGLITLIILFIWNGVFILQSGIGYQGNLLLLPLKFLPIFLYTFAATWIILRLFAVRKTKRKRWPALVLGGIAVLLSCSFQYYIVDKHARPFVFKNEMFSHLQPVQIKNNFKNRIVQSTAGYILMMPLANNEYEAISYIANVAAETLLLIEFKEFVQDGTLANTCKQYVEKKETYSDCIIDFQKEIYANYQLTSAGGILMTAIGTLGISKIKKIMSKQNNQDNKYILIKSTNDVIETILLSLWNFKNDLSLKNKKFLVTWGHNVTPSSELSTVQDQILHTYKTTAINKVAVLIESTEKKISEIKGPTGLLEKEMERFQILKTDLLTFKEDLRLEKSKHQKDMKKNLTKKLNKPEKSSVLLNLFMRIF